MAMLYPPALNSILDILLDVILYTVSQVTSETFLPTSWATQHMWVGLNVNKADNTALVRTAKGNYHHYTTAAHVKPFLFSQFSCYFLK